MWPFMELHVSGACTGSETKVTWVQFLIPLRSVCMTLGDVVALSVWFLTMYRLFLAFSYMIMFLLPSSFLHVTILLLAWTDASTMPAFIRYNVTTRISQTQFLFLLSSPSP